MMSKGCVGTSSGNEGNFVRPGILASGSRALGGSDAIVSRGNYISYVKTNVTIESRSLGYEPRHGSRSLARMP